MPDRGGRKVWVSLFLLLAPVSAALGRESSPPPAAPASRTGSPAWLERVHLGGTFEADFAWTDKADPADRNSGSSSDLFVSTVELGAGVDVTDWLTGNLVLLAEDLGTDDETGVTVDEAAVTLHKKCGSFSLVAGKRVQPFGVFENHLVADPMTQDAYETNRPGVTVEYEGPMGLGLSATVYGGEEMMTHLFESELFDTESITRAENPASDDVSSYILAASATPMGGHFTLFGAFLSEPGAGDRNDTVSVGVHFETDGLAGFRADGEYMKAVGRERYEGFDRAFKEGVLSLTAAYEFVMRRREVIGGAFFADRIAHVLAEPLEIAVRYEQFDDDGMADSSQTSSVKDRYGAGARYSLFSDPESGLAAYLGGEYRHTEYRVHPSQKDSRADSTEEFFVRLGLVF